MGTVTARNEAIISIHPRHAHAILDGKKTIELRRRIPLLPVGTKLWIYATRPLGAVIGTAIINQVVRGDPVEIWQKFGKQSGLERSEYDAYFQGSNEAIGLLLNNAQRSHRNVPIEDLRGLRLGFHPPQVITWISDGEAQCLSQMAMAN
jgi:predicted transcriptional regulator